jgi:stage IV sporulation protein FB
MFFLLTAFLGGALSASTPEQWHRVAIFMVAAFLSILIHELGHAIAGLKRGAPQVGIQLHGMGGTAIFPYARFDRTSNLIVTASGPLASLALAGAAFGVLTLAANRWDTQQYPLFLLYYFFATLFAVNLFWTVFNLFPVLPLDGGQLVRAFLGEQRLKTTCIISFTALAFMAVILWLLTASLFNLILILLFASYTWKVWQSTKNQGA